MRLVEKYRPRTFDDVIGQERAIAERLAEIAFAESGNGADLPYADIVRRGKGNVRACLQLLETALVRVTARP